MKKFKTKDLKLSAFLYASHLKLVGYEKLSGSISFEFSPVVSAEILHKSYIEGNALIDPKELIYKLNDLKSLIFNLGRLEGKDSD